MNVKVSDVQVNNLEVSLSDIVQPCPWSRGPCTGPAWEREETWQKGRCKFPVVSQLYPAHGSGLLAELSVFMLLW